MSANRTVGVSPRDRVWDLINELMLEVEVKPDLVSISKVEPPDVREGRLTACSEPTPRLPA